MVDENQHWLAMGAALTLDRLTLATIFACAWLGVATTPPRAQQISEGGMRFYKRNVDAMSYRSGSTSGINAQGSASVTGGTINTGASLSDVASELNPLADPSVANQELNIAGEPRQWNESLRLQRSSPSSITYSSNVIAIGNLDDNIRTILTINPRLVETIKIASPTNPSQPLSKVQLSETYEKLEGLLDSQAKGVHIFSASAIELPKPTKPNKSPANSLNAWTSDEQIRASSRYSGFASDINSISSEKENIIRVTALGPVGTTRNSSNFSVIGFSRNINPNDGKVSSITAFATNNRTVGTIRVPDKNDGTKITLEEIAEKYGTTPEQLAVVNNLPDVNTDITGLNLTVPADLLTADYYVVKPASDAQTNETPRSLAKRLGVNVSWLMDLNGWNDSNQILPAGERVQVPGLTKSCNSAPNANGCRDTTLPAAKPLAPQLETADYGAYTKTEVTYDCSGALKSFCQRFLKPSR